MQAGARATLFHVASSKENNLHYPHYPTGSDSFCNYNKVRTDGTSTYKLGPGLPILIVLELKLMFEQLSHEYFLSKCLHGITTNQNKTFDAMSWDRLPKSRYVTFTPLQFVLYDAVTNFNIGRKASALIFEELGMIPRKYTLTGSQIKSVNSTKLLT